MTKQEKIQEAYGKFYHKSVNQDGWIKFSLNLPNGIGNWLLSNKDSLFDVKIQITCVQFRPKSLHGIEDNNGWIKIEKESNLPETGIEVLCFNENWIDEDFNPNGIRIGFLNDEEWITAHWWNYQDTYMTISHSDCDDDESYGGTIRDNIDPTHYKLIDEKSPIY